MNWKFRYFGKYSESLQHDGMNSLFLLKYSIKTVYFIKKAFSKQTRSNNIKRNKIRLQGATRYRRKDGRSDMACFICVFHIIMKGDQDFRYPFTTITTENLDNPKQIRVKLQRPVS
jgi:hypothetical protein